MQFIEFVGELDSRKNIINAQLTFGIPHDVRLAPSQAASVNKNDARYHLPFTLILTIETGSHTWAGNSAVILTLINRKSVRDGLIRAASNITANKGWIVSFTDITSDASSSGVSTKCHAVPYVLFDCVNLAYGSDRVPTLASGALLNIWTLMLGKTVFCLPRLSKFM